MSLPLVLLQGYSPNDSFTYPKNWGLVSAFSVCTVAFSPKSHVCGSLSASLPLFFTLVFCLKLWWPLLQCRSYALLVRRVILYFLEDRILCLCCLIKFMNIQANDRFSSSIFHNHDSETNKNIEYQPRLATNCAIVKLRIVCTLCKYKLKNTLSSEVKRGIWMSSGLAPLSKQGQLWS